MLYDTLAVGEADTAIHVTVYTSTTQGEGVVNLWVRSLGEPSLRDSITTRTIVGSGVNEGICSAVGKPWSAATVVTGRLHVPGPGELFDPAGRRAAVLRPGDNRIDHLSSGVYLIRAGGISARFRVVVR